MLKIAIAQSVITSDIYLNAKHASELAIEAANNGARLILFPEAGLTGYVQSEIKDPSQFHYKNVKEQLIRVCDVARAKDIWIVCGGYAPSADLNRPYNCLYIISNKGELVGRYDKLYLSYNEAQNWYSKGADRVVVQEIDGIIFGFAICIEAVFPHHFGDLASHNVDCVLFSTYGIDDRIQKLLIGHATAFNYWIAASQPAKNGNLFKSMLIEPNGDIATTTLTADSVEIIYSYLDKEAPHLSTELNLARPWRSGVRKTKSAN